MTSPTARERAAREGPSGAGRREAATDGGSPALVPVPASADPAALALELWRQVCRTDPFEETVARLLEVVSRALPVRAVVLARVEEGKLVRVGVAHRPAGGGAMAPAAGEAVRLDLLRALLGGARVAEGPLTALAAAAPGLVAAGTEGHFVLGALESADALLGVVVIVTGAGAPPRAEVLRLVGHLLEPLTSLLQREVAASSGARPVAEPNVTAEPGPRTLEPEEPAEATAAVVVGASLGLRGVMDLVECAAPADVPVLIVGETGSGKEVIARVLHERSTRAGGPFIKVNCGAIPSELVDSELFGHERGSFTGAVAARRGWFERAHGGTLFLDEIGELPLAAQVRLLRVLQDGTFERVGAQKTLSVNVRILAATHRDLARMAAAGTFRRDLWYRLSVFPIHVPPLRERPSDLEPLAAHLAARAGERIHGMALSPTEEDLRLLRSHSWPGNVRELAAVIERAALLGGGRGLDVAAALHLGPRVEEAAARPEAARPVARAVKTLQEVMVEHIERALALTGGRIEGASGAAALLDVNPHTLRARMRKLGIDWTRFRGPGPAGPARG